MIHGQCSTDISAPVRCWSAEWTTAEPTASADCCRSATGNVWVNVNLKIVGWNSAVPKNEDGTRNRQKVVFLNMFQVRVDEGIDVSSAWLSIDCTIFSSFSFGNELSQPSMSISVMARADFTYMVSVSSIIARASTLSSTRAPERKGSQSIRRLTWSASMCDVRQLVSEHWP